jgi:hypothetical protein
MYACDLILYMMYCYTEHVFWIKSDSIELIYLFSFYNMLAVDVSELKSSFT